MVALIEEQMLQYLVDLEEERCKALETEDNKSEKTRGKKVKRRKISKPWKRAGQHALCQEIELLAMVYEYDYDLADSGFQDYCSMRGVLYVAGERGTRRWDFFLDHTKQKADYLDDPYFRFAEEVGGDEHRFSDEDMDTGWKIIQLGRAKLQDCWELYTNKDVSDAE